MNIADAFPSRYLKAADLGDQQPIMTVDRIEYEPVGMDKEMKLVCYFKGQTKGMVLNATNARMLETLSNSVETDNWAGVQVKLFVADVTFQGRMVEAIRMKSPARLRAGKVAGKVVAAPIQAPPVEDDPAETDDDNGGVPF